MPLFAILVVVLFRKLGYASTALLLSLDAPKCIWGGISYGMLFRGAGELASTSITFAPVMIIWTIGGAVVLALFKRKAE